MLSIGKLTPGRVAYYVDQAPGGADEYYTRPDAEVGRWLGGAARNLGLSGSVEAEGFARLLDGRHPATGESLGAPTTTDHRVAGFDLCFSAPKSVSVAWALGAPALADAVAACHDRAVAATIGLAETEAVRARRGAGGARLIASEGMAAAAFTHRTSRAGDPQVHTHVVVANVTVDGQGRWSALDSTRLYRMAKTLGYAYQAALRAELASTLGFAFEPVRKGVGEIVGVPRPVRDEFSTRRALITAAVGPVTDGASRRAAQTAALATRAPKAADEDLAALRQAGRSAPHRSGSTTPRSPT